MNLRHTLIGLFTFQMIFAPVAQAASGCGVDSGSDPFLYEVIRESYVYSELQLRGKQEGEPGSCVPIQQVVALYRQNGGGISGCQAIASCGYIKQFAKEFDARNWQKGKAGEDHCFRGPEVPVWEKTVCAKIEKSVLEAQARSCPNGICTGSRANSQQPQMLTVTPSSALGSGGVGQGGAGQQGYSQGYTQSGAPPSSSARGESVAPGAVSATTGAPAGQQTYVASQQYAQQSVVYTNGASSSSGIDIDKKWLWGLGGVALGIGAGYLIWGNQYKTNYVYVPQNQPSWQNLGPKAWGQVPGSSASTGYTPYGVGAFGQTSATGGYNPYGLGGSYQLTRPW